MSKLPDHLERYLTICQQVYQRMERDGSWPWPENATSRDSHESEDVVDSDHNSPSS